MRKLYTVTLLAIIFLQGCGSLDSVLNPVTDTSVPTSTPTITYTPSKTPTASVTPTPSPSATIVRIPTQDPNKPTETFIPIPIFIGNDTATPVLTSTPIRPGAGFLSISISDKKIFWGECTPNKTTITVQVDNPEEIVSVIIFTQVKNMKKEDYTPWTSGNVMYNNFDGSFTYVMVGSEVEGHNHYKNSWVRFQLVATNIEGEEIGRSKIYTEEIDLSPCMCYEPLKGCPIATPKKP